jgi:nicotinamide riboside kinase
LANPLKVVVTVTGPAKTGKSWLLEQIEIAIRNHRSIYLMPIEVELNEVIENG